MKRILALVGLVVTAGSIAGLVWTTSGPLVGNASEMALKVHTTIEIETEPWLSFRPESFTVGLVLYPASRVQALAYAPLARQLAERGLLVVVIDPSFRTPVLSLNAADDVITAYPEVEIWAVGGHGLGGKVAASFAERRPEVKGLVLMGTLTPSFLDLSENDLLVISVVGSLDGFVSVVDIESSSSRMPSNFVIRHIDGANHAQFGDFGELGFDGEASMSAAEQRNRAADLISEALASLSESG